MSRLAYPRVKHLHVWKLQGQLRDDSSTRAGSKTFAWMIRVIAEKTEELWGHVRRSGRCRRRLTAEDREMQIPADCRRNPEKLRLYLPPENLTHYRWHRVANLADSVDTSARERPALWKRLEACCFYRGKLPVIPMKGTGVL